MEGDGDSIRKRNIKRSVFLRDFKQQAASAWVPRYRPNSISPTLIGFGVVLVPLGIVVLIVSSNTSSDIKEISIDYTNCQSVNKNPSVQCADYIRSPGIWTEEGHQVCKCDVGFELTKPMNGDKIYMYYTLENFHQNSRKYANSKDDDQLLGKLGTADSPNEPSNYCRHYDKDSAGRIIYPCGAFANSFFNDTIQLYYQHETDGEIKIQQNRRGLAWSSDLNYRYKNPDEFYNRSHPIWDKFTKPNGWNRTIWDLDPEDPSNNGVQNEDFMIWMRPAAFSNFRKPYRIIETRNQSQHGLPAGKYRLKIDYTYEVVSFGGRKGVALVAPTIFGTQNLFQGYALVSLGGFTVLLGLLFLVCGCNTRHGKGSFTKSDLYAE